MNQFSIILPVFNGGELLKECVNSIIGQTYNYFNLIVLDNSSNDGTKEWLQGLENDKIIIHSASQSLGIVGNWGRIKGIPKNEFITLIGHDDLLHSNYLEEVNKLIEKHPAASLYQTHFNYIDADGDFVKPCKPMAAHQTVSEFIACQMAQTLDSMGTGYMMRSKDFDSLGGMPQNYPNLIYADYELWVKLTQIGYKATSEQFCFSYRVHQSVSKTTNGQAYSQAFETYISFINSLLVEEKIKHVVEKYGHDFLMYFCESLSHRILKTSSKNRTIKVEKFVESCVAMAQLIIPGQNFDPLKKFRISVAKKIDNNQLGSYLFRKIRSL